MSCSVLSCCLEKWFDIDGAGITWVPARIGVDNLQNFKAVRFVKAPRGLVANIACAGGKRLYFKNHYPCLAESIRRALKQRRPNAFALRLFPHGQPEYVSNMGSFLARHQKACYGLIDLSNDGAKAPQIGWQQFIDDFPGKIVWQRGCDLDTRAKVPISSPTSQDRLALSGLITYKWLCC